MSEEKKKGQSWNTVECECPYCGHIQSADNVPGDQVCEGCEKTYEIDDPS